MPSPRAMRWPFRAGRRTRGATVSVALLVFALLATARAEDEEPEPAPEPEILLAPISTDPEGGADLLVGRARRALEAEEHERAFEALVELAERHPDVVVPLASLLGPEADEALRWPARTVANLALARLPDPGPAQLEERWAPDAFVLLERARRGDVDAWRTLAMDFGALDVGARALLLLGDLDLEAGRVVEAARHFELWLLLRPEASAPVRAAVVARIADALAAVDDAGGLEQLTKDADVLLDERVTLGNRTIRLGRHLQSAAKRRPPRSRKGEPALPDTLDLLWTIDMEDPDWLYGTWSEQSRFPMIVRAGVLADDDALVIHGGRTVRRVDLVTGAEQWRFPDLRQASIHAPDLRYRPHDVPVREVTRAGDVVLCVLGDPGATGSYKFLGEKVEVKDIGQELRMRLVALDVETGALRWYTGGPDEQHPVLGDRATGCASPPLVVGDNVYCVFARRRGVGEYHVACLDLATGNERWVRRLAISESGRSRDRTDDERFVGSRLQALAFGARPVHAAGEILVVPHAGFAAGVDAEDGTVNWVRALPRYALHAWHPQAGSPQPGHAATNQAVAWGDAWILAPMDCPRLVCLARGNGALRWHTGPLDPSEHPTWCHLYGVGFDTEGRPAVELANALPLLLDARDPSRPALAGDVEYAYEIVGRPWLEDRVLYHVIGGELAAIPLDDIEDAPMDGVMLPGEAPQDGSPIRVGDVWVVVGDRYVAGLAADPSVLERDDAPPSDALRARDAVAAAIRARWSNRPSVLDVAFDRVEAIASDAHRDAAYRRISEELERWLRGLWIAASDPARSMMLGERVASLAELVSRLPPDHRGTPYVYAIEALIQLGRAKPAIDHIEAWIAEPGRTLVPFPPRPRIAAPMPTSTEVFLRGDLVAADLFERLRSSIGAQAHVAAYEQKMDERISAALGADEDVLREAIRRAAGTAAATRGRTRLRERLADAGRLYDAGAIDADLRLDMSARDREGQGRVRLAAKHQLSEAVARLDTGDLAGARSLLTDLARWAPPGVRDLRGRRVDALLTEVEAREGRRPTYDPDPMQIDLWKGLDAPRERDQISSVQVLPVRGPGLAKLADRLPVARGLTFEFWSALDQGRLASLPGEDEGWFGGQLHAVDRYVPGAGILVTSVVAGEPADRSTVRANDWIRSWSGQRVPDLSSFMRAVAGARPGQTIDIEVFRDGRQILDRFRAGRRPIEQRAGLVYASLYAAEDGRVLLPGRTGLSWVDPQTMSRETFWRWTEPGVVSRAHVFGGAGYVQIQRNLVPDLVVRIDLERGVEVWRAEVPGRVLRVQATGSALWVDTREPQTALVIDRHSGSVRARYDAIPVTRDEYRRTWTSAYTADAAANGWGYVAVGQTRAPRLHCVNTTTGRHVWQERWGAVETSDGDYLDPYVSADAVVGVMQGPDELLLLVPDPTGREPRDGERFVVGPDHLRTDAPHGGPLEGDTRIHIRGRTVHVVRNSRSWRRVTVWTLNVNFDLLRNTNADPTAGDPVELKINQRMLADTPEGSSPWPYVLHIVPEFDGVYVTGATLSNDPYVEVWFVSEYGTTRLLMDRVIEARRHAPVRIGERILVPTDRGALIAPLESFDDR